MITTMVALESAQLEAPAPAEGISDAALEEKTQQLQGLIKDISKEEASKGEAPCEKAKKKDALMQLYDDAQHNGVDVKGPLANKFTRSPEGGPVPSLPEAAWPGRESSIQEAMGSSEVPA